MMNANLHLVSLLGFSFVAPHLRERDDVAAQQRGGKRNRIEIIALTSSPEKENNIEYPLKRKCDVRLERLKGSTSKVLKPLKSLPADNLSISNLVADVNQTKVASDESLKKIADSELVAVMAGNVKAMEIAHTNDLNIMAERNRVAIEALKEKISF